MPRTDSSASSVNSPFFIAIGASGGEGLDDIKAVLAQLPASLPAVVLVVLHRPSDKISNLAAVLGRSACMPVLIASEDELFRVGHCYVGEPDGHLTLAGRSRVRLVDGGDHRHRNRSVDILFNSIAAHARERGLGVVLSGSLDDGARGLAAIKRAGGATMVISEDGTVQSGMPLNAAEFNGVVDVAGSARQIAREIVARVLFQEHPHAEDPKSANHP